MRIKWLFLILLFAAPAFAQNVRVDNVTFSSVQGFPFLPGATITICTAAGTGTPCTPIVSGTCLSISDTTCNQSATITADAFGNYGFWIQPGSYTYTVTKAGFGGFGPRALTLPCQPASTCTTTGPQTINANLTVSGTGTFTGSLLCKTFENVLCADQFAGTTCGDKINAAASGQSNVQIWINQACGLGSGASPWTAITISGVGVSLVFIQPGNYFHGGITLNGNNDTITSPFPCAQGPNNLTPCAVTLTEGNSLNLAAAITINGAEDAISNIAMDGNNTNNVTGGVVVKVNNANRARLHGTNVQHGATHGLWIFSTVGTDNSCCMTIEASEFQGNTNDGILCQNTTDLFMSPLDVSQTNGSDGVELSDCGGVRIVGGEFSGNNSTGGNAAIEVYGTVAGGGSNNTQIAADSFGNNSKHDVMITGFNTANTSLGNAIIGNRFVAGTSPGRAANNTYDNIRLIDGGQNTITGNILTGSAAAHQNKYNIEITETAGSRAFRSAISGNESNGNNGSVGNQMGGNANDLTVNPSNFSSNYEGGNSSQVGPNVYLLNNDSLQWKTAAGALDAVLRMDGSNNVVLLGDATTQRIFFQNNGVTVLGPLTGTGIGNSVGLQFFNTTTTCTTAATINTPCTTAAITLPVGYADTNYRLSISCLGVTAFPQVQTYTKSNTTFTITLNNLTAAAATCSSFDVIAGHN